MENKFKDEPKVINMNVFTISLNETEGMILVYANSKEKAMELFLTSEASPVHINEIDLDDVKVDIYPTRMKIEINTEAIGEWCISQDL